MNEIIVFVAGLLTGALLASLGIATYLNYRDRKRLEFSVDDIKKGGSL